VNNIIQTTLTRYAFLLALFTLTGCSALDSYRTPNQTTARGLPQIPEIKRQQTFKPRYVPPSKAVVRAPTEVVNQTVQTLLITKQQQLEEQQRLQQQAKQNATLDIDPFADIPENSSNSKPLPGSSIPNNFIPPIRAASPAVKSLITSARADIALGRSRSAISKLERGLRIEPGNAQLWHMLARSHYTNSAFLHSISIAKKSNSLTNNNDLIAENWELIKQAGERSGNASAIKEALDYMKANP